MRWNSARLALNSGSPMRALIILYFSLISSSLLMILFSITVATLTYLSPKKNLPRAGLFNLSVILCLLIGILFPEPLYPSLCIHDLLRTGKERMTAPTYLKPHLLYSTACPDHCPASAFYSCFCILRMNAFFHDSTPPFSRT